MTNLILALKLVHILGASVLFGTGLGIAFFMWMANRSGDPADIAATAGTVVIADTVFTAVAACSWAWCVVMPLLASSVWRRESAWAWASWARTWPRLASVLRTWASAAARPAFRPVSSSRASTWPFLTLKPSSISTSVSVPVICADTVACRRAVT